jgi:hypothetical protein
MFDILCSIATQLASKRFAVKDTDIRQDMLSSFISHGLNENDVKLESVLQSMFKSTLIFLSY